MDPADFRAQLEEWLPPEDWHSPVRGKGPRAALDAWLRDAATLHRVARYVAHHERDRRLVATAIERERDEPLRLEEAVT